MGRQGGGEGWGGGGRKKENFGISHPPKRHCKACNILRLKISVDVLNKQMLSPFFFCLFVCVWLVG